MTVVETITVVDGSGDDVETVVPELVMLEESVTGGVVEPCVRDVVDGPVVTVVGSSVVTVAACVVF